MPMTDFLLPEFDQEMANTRKVLERIPEDRFDFKPHPKSWDMASLATHVSWIPSWIVNTIEQDELDVAPADGPPIKITKATSRADLLATFDRHVAAGRTALSGTSDEHLLKPWTLKATGKSLFTMPRAAVLRTFVFSHGIHHRAQLCIYLRLTDTSVPGMYGPSADDSAFMKP
jgi:uncharacterized damage-inducible protein DinB